MPPRYSYWTIIAGGLPTAFRAADREDILPTFKRIQEKHPDAEMKWFARGKLWESPEAARADTEKRRRAPEGVRTGTVGGAGISGPGSRRPSSFDKAQGAPGASRGTGVREEERRGRDWRPGGEHRDPRQRFKDAKKEQNQERRKERFDRKQGLASATPHSGGGGPKPRERSHGDPLRPEVPSHARDRQNAPHGPANRLRQGYGGPPNLPAKAEAGHYVPKPRNWDRSTSPKPRSGEGGPKPRTGGSGVAAPKRRSRGGGH